MIAIASPSSTDETAAPAREVDTAPAPGKYKPPARAGAESPVEGAEPDRAWFDDVAARFDQGTQRAVLRLFRAATPAAREQAGRELRGPDVPALVVHGDRDPWHPPRTGQAYAAVLPQSELLELPAAGHWPWLGDPDVVGRVLGFLRP